MKNFFGGVSHSVAVPEPNRRGIKEAKNAREMIPRVFQFQG
jgi:hypothetical protein